MNIEMIRRYPANSAQACARVLAALLVADGQLTEGEFAWLNSPELAEGTGLSAVELRVVLCDHLADLALAAPDTRVRINTPAVLDRMLDEITDPALRVKVCALALSAIAADEVIAPAERAVFEYALQRWGLSASQLVAQLERRAA